MEKGRPYNSEMLLDLVLFQTTDLLSLTHFDVISRSYKYFSSISTLLEGNSTLLALLVLIIVKFFPSPSIEGVNMPGLIN